MDLYKCVVFPLLRTISLDTQKSNDEQRVMAMTLSTGKTLDPVSFKVPRHATFTDVDGFIKELTQPSPSPLTRATNLVKCLKALAAAIQSMVQTTTQASLVSLPCSSIQQVVRILTYICRWLRPSNV